MRPSRVSLVAILVACGSSPSRRSSTAVEAVTPATPVTIVAPPAFAAARQLTVDNELTTASGATVDAPRGWWLATDATPPTTLVLEDPDRAVRVTLSEAAEPDPLAAITAAWRAASPGFALAPRGEPDVPPPTDGSTSCSAPCTRPA
jgi:hypothetical protein